MFSEHDTLFDPNNIMLIIGVVISEMFEDLNLHSCLMLKLLLVPDDLHCHHFFLLMIKALQSLSKTSWSKWFKYFKPICDVILICNFVITPIIIISIVMCLKWRALYLIWFKSKEEDLLIIQDLTFLIIRELTHITLESFTCCDRELNWSSILIIVLYLWMNWDILTLVGLWFDRMVPPLTRRLFGSQLNIWNTVGLSHLLWYLCLILDLHGWDGWPLLFLLWCIQRALHLTVLDWNCLALLDCSGEILFAQFLTCSEVKFFTLTCSLLSIEIYVNLKSLDFVMSWWHCCLVCMMGRLYFRYLLSVAHLLLHSCLLIMLLLQDLCHMDIISGTPTGVKVLVLYLRVLGWVEWLLGLLILWLCSWYWDINIADWGEILAVLWIIHRTILLSRSIHLPIIAERCHIHFCRLILNSLERVIVLVDWLSLCLFHIVEFLILLMLGHVWCIMVLWYISLLVDSLG